MPGKSRKRRGKFKQQSKNRKIRRNPQIAISQQEVSELSEEAPVLIPEVAVSTPEKKDQIDTKKHELYIELRRIGIFGSIMLVVLIILAITLK